MNAKTSSLSRSGSWLANSARANQDWIGSTLIANQPSAGQRAASCIDLLRDVERQFIKLKTLTDAAQYASGGLAGELKKPEFRARVSGYLTDLQLKIQTITSQCRDLLPAADLAKLKDIENKVKDIQKKLNNAGGGLDIDWSGIANGLSDLGKGIASGILGAIIWTLQQIFRPANAS